MRLSDHITLPASFFIFLVAALTAFAFMVGLELASRVPFWSQGSVALAPSLLILATALYLAGRKATVRRFGS
ncbi:hypothetical protein [Burkholderia gladioli]|uniref:hypothetical protein n=1 Tax=Burkholderia gladioli TaxID=28095 RepID=UPI000BF12F11|nr:hypothetical protein [Burkholderia gladioli]